MLRMLPLIGCVAMFSQFSMSSATADDSVNSFASLNMNDISARLESVEMELAAINESVAPKDYAGKGISNNCCRHGIIAAVDVLYLRPKRSGLDFAISDPNNDNNIEGPVEALRLDANGGVRGSLGYATLSGWDLVFTYTHFDTSDQVAIAGPAGGWLWLTQANPAADNNVADTANATASLNYDLFDVEVGRNVSGSSCVPIRLFGGFRGATIKEETEFLFTGGNINPPYREQKHHMQVDAYGLRGGAEVQWSPLGRLSFFGRAAGSVLIGDFSVSYIENEPGFPGQGQVNVTYNYSQVIPMLEAACGLGWESGPFSLQAGYELSALLNLDQRMVFSGAETINRGQMAYANQDLVLEGLFLRAAYNY